MNVKLIENNKLGGGKGMGRAGSLIRMWLRALQQSASTLFVTPGSGSRRALGDLQCEDFAQRLEQRNAKTVLLLKSFI